MRLFFYLFIYLFCIGAVSYGLDMRVIESRIIPWSFGIEVKGNFDEETDPIRLR
jgi:hypothetical protein